MYIFLRKLSVKLAYHFSGFGILAKYAFFIIFLVPFGGQHFYEMLLPTSSYYQYDASKPIELVSGNKVGENAIMSSNSIYKRGIDATWYDSMYCDGVKKITQEWREYISPESLKLDWEFHTYTFDEKDTKCRVCGKIVGTTSRGYNKTLAYCSDYFLIER